MADRKLYMREFCEELNRRIIHKHHINLAQYELNSIIDEFIDLMKEKIIEGETVCIKHLGKFYTKRLKPQNRKSPKSDEYVYVPARDTVRFSAFKTLKKAVFEETVDWNEE